MTRSILLLPLLFAPILLTAQSGDTVHVATFPGSTLAQMLTAAQATCSATVTCVVYIDPTLATVPQGTLPAPCATCVWLDFRTPASMSITGNLYVNGTLIGPASGNGGSGNNSGSGTGGTLASPTFSPGSGTYSSAQTVTLGLPSGATGCYTLDGTTPAGASGTCTFGYTYSTPIYVTDTKTINALATESGWTNSSVASGVYAINLAGLPGYSDSFTRNSGGLGSNWSEPYQGDASLQLINGLVYSAAPGAEVTHSLEVYTGGTFANNQYSIITVASGIGSNNSGQAGQTAIVRGSLSTASGDGFYNDAVATGTSFGGLGAYRIGNSVSHDFCAVGQALTNYAVGDTHELDVAGTNPVFFWSRHNGVVDATCYTSAYAFSGGSPGLGVIDHGATPQVALGPWQGGSLPAFSGTASDSFQRANSSWLGVNWWEDLLGYNTSYFVLNNNAVSMSASTTSQALAIWTTPFNQNQSSTVTLGNMASGDWLAAVVRCSLSPEPMVSGHETFYLALDDGGVIDLFVYTQGSWEMLANLGTYTGLVNTLELDASGSSPVSLTVKVNGTLFGGAYLDSKYVLTGTYAGFAAFGSSSSTITGWIGANL